MVRGLPYFFVSFFGFLFFSPLCVFAFLVFSRLGVVFFSGCSYLCPFLNFFISRFANFGGYFGWFLSLSVAYTINSTHTRKEIPL